MILNLSKNKRRELMKKFLGLFIILFMAVMFVNGSCQSNSNYRISWDPDVSGKTVNWNLYLEQQPTDTGFVLVPGVNRENTDLSQPGIISIQNIPVGTTEAVIELANDAYFLVAGVEAMSSAGVWTNLGLNTSPFQKGDAPPIPGGITIERLP